MWGCSKTLLFLARIIVLPVALHWRHNNACKKPWQLVYFAIARYAPAVASYLDACVFLQIVPRRTFMSVFHSFGPDHIVFGHFL